MGSEDLFRKRKQRKSADLERKSKNRAPIQRFLIVCEGEKTEPYYLQDLVGDLGIPPLSVVIRPNNGSSPDRVVEYARVLYEEDARSGDAFDKVFCVFDMDGHTTYSGAIARTHALGNHYVAITSVPCFEYWLLLHFGYTDKPFTAAGSKSACDSIVSDLKKKQGFKNYGKGQRGVYEALRNLMSTATSAAVKRLSECETLHKDNPSTHVHLLIEELTKLKPQ
jgi:RloB-like protein